MGETVSSEKSVKSQGNEKDEAELSAPPKKVTEEKCNRKEDWDKSVPPNKHTKAEKKNEPLKKDKSPSKKGEEYSLASELWQLKRKGSQCHHQLTTNKKLKGDFDSSSLPRITVDRKANIAKNTIEDKPMNKNIDEALDKHSTKWQIYISLLRSLKLRKVVK